MFNILSNSFLFYTVCQSPVQNNFLCVGPGDPEKLWKMA